ncbi:Ig-like domain-containing protein [Salmonella enterica]|nr:Ig-like domain-containing protein [Salmonella enterica]ELF4914103.1 Ig-like domain-containing protein [Salmonella enterica]
MPDATEKPVGDGPGSTFTATVKDNTGAPVKDAEIKWRQDGGTDYRLSADTVRTDDQGQAQVTLTDPMHKATDRITVTATYNGRSVGADVAYLADATTAAVSALTLTDPTVTTREANGTDAFTWNALVTDQYGNKVKNADVTWSTDTPNLRPVQTTSRTDATGVAVTTLVSATPENNVHMLAKTAVQQTPYTSPVGVSFVVQGAATITGTVTTDNSVADGTAADVVTITVTAPNGNPVTGVDLTADLSKSNGVQTTDGKTNWALDAAGKAIISFTTTVAGTHSIAFSVPDSANAKAGAGTVNITFVAGPVDAAQSEVTVPVGAAVQGDPLELHLYARDANRNPVSAAQLDKVNTRAVLFNSTAWSTACQVTRLRWLPAAFTTVINEKNASLIFSFVGGPGPDCCGDTSPTSLSLSLAGSSPHAYYREGDCILRMIRVFDIILFLSTLHLRKRLATAACDSGSGSVSLVLRLIQRELYSWNTQPTGELNPAHSIPTTLSFASLNWLLTPTPTSQK